MLTLCSDPFTSFVDATYRSQHHLRQMLQIAERIKLITEFELFSEEVYNSYANRSTDGTEAHRRETQKLLDHPLLQSDYNNFQLLSYKYSLQSLLFARMGNHAQNIATNHKVLSLYETQLAIDKMGYWNIIANLTQSLIMAGNFENYSLWMKKLSARYYQKLPVDCTYIDNMLRTYKNIFESGAYFRFIAEGKVAPEAVRSFTKRILRSYATEQKHITPFHFISLVYKTAACCLLIGDVDDSIRLLQKLFNEESDHVNPIATKNARLLLLMIHAQLGNTLLSTSLAKSFALYGKKIGSVSTAEVEFVKQLAQLAALQTKRERTAWFRKLNENLSNVKPGTDIKRMLESVPVKKWAEMNI